MNSNDSARDVSAFLSYVRADDDHDDGRITSLRRCLSEEVGMQTGHVFSIFQDREDIFVGERWRTRIQLSIDGSTLLIAIVTPSFLQSDDCRKEIGLFLDRERRLGRDDLILPVLYVPTPGLRSETDDIAKDLSRRQYFDWTTHRFASLTSNDVRRAIAELAGQVVSAIERYRVSEKLEIRLDEPEISDGHGFIELLAAAETAMPQLTETMISLRDKLEHFARETQATTREMESADATGRPSSAKLAAIHRLTQRLQDPVSEMEQLADEYVDQLMRVGGGIDALVRRVPELTAEEDISAAKNLLKSLTELAQIAGTSLDSLDDFRHLLIKNYSLSSTLRPVLKRTSAAARRMLPSKQVYSGWRDDLKNALSQHDGATN